MQQFQVMDTQLVPSIDATILIVTSQGQQNTYFPDQLTVDALYMNSL